MYKGEKNPKWCVVPHSPLLLCAPPVTLESRAASAEAATALAARFGSVVRSYRTTLLHQSQAGRAVADLPRVHATCRALYTATAGPTDTTLASARQALFASRDQLFALTQSLAGSLGAVKAAFGEVDGAGEGDVDDAVFDKAVGALIPTVDPAAKDKVCAVMRIGVRVVVHANASPVCVCCLHHPPRPKLASLTVTAPSECACCRLPLGVWSRCWRCVPSCRSCGTTRRLPWSPSLPPLPTWTPRLPSCGSAGQSC